MVPFSGDAAGQPLPSVKPEEFVAGFTADGNSIYVADTSSLPAKMYVMNLKTGERKLHHQFAPADPSGVLGVGSGQATPDGQFYTYGVGRTLSYLYVVEGLK
jgi:hypothetical protein